MQAIDEDEVETLSLGLQARQRDMRWLLHRGDQIGQLGSLEVEEADRAVLGALIGIDCRMSSAASVAVGLADEERRDPVPHPDLERPLRPALQHRLEQRHAGLLTHCRRKGIHRFARAVANLPGLVDAPQQWVGEVHRDQPVSAFRAFT